MKYWRAFLSWRFWELCAQGWKRFLHWSGWKAFVRWPGWSAFARWKLWHPHPVITAVLALVCAAGLTGIFLRGWQETLPAVPVYVLSAYTLTAASLGLPRFVKWFRRNILGSRLIRPLVEDEGKRFLLNLFREQIINFGYGVFKTVSGLLLMVPWIWADGLYNLLQGIIQLGQLVLHRKHMDLTRQWKSYRVCGWLILVVHLTITGPVFMMIHQGQAEEYPGYMIFATAAFAFYKLITAAVEVARDRKHASPVDSSVYLLDLTQSLFSIFSLQVAMLHTFDDGSMNKILMNSLTGGAVCLLVMGTSVYMICRANRELKNREGEDNGGIL